MSYKDPEQGRYVELDTMNRVLSIVRSTIDKTLFINLAVLGVFIQMIIDKQSK